jgi:hypothetical protein
MWKRWQNFLQELKLRLTPMIPRNRNRMNTEWIQRRIEHGD